LREFRRTPRVRYVESRVEEDMVAGGAWGQQEEGGTALNQPCGGANLVPIGDGGGGDCSVQRSGALETRERRRGEADLRRGDEVKRPQRQNRAAPAKLRCGGAGGEREGVGTGEISSRWRLRAFTKRYHALQPTP
jgi:hypothetical protein